MRKPLLSNTQLAVSSIYLLAVIACIPMAFDFAGSINLVWTLVLIVLTLPCSLVSILFAWGLIHGAGLEFFSLMYVTLAILNVLWVNAIVNWSRKNRMAEIESRKLRSIRHRDQQERSS
jgi:hypothetical protein